MNEIHIQEAGGLRTADLQVEIVDPAVIGRVAVNEKAATGASRPR